MRWTPIAIWDLAPLNLESLRDVPRVRVLPSQNSEGSGRDTSHPTWIARQIVEESFGFSGRGVITYIASSAGNKNGYGQLRAANVKVVNMSVYMHNKDFRIWAPESRFDLDPTRSAITFLEELDREGKILVLPAGAYFSKSPSRLRSFLGFNKVSNLGQNFPALLVGSIDPEGQLSEMTPFSEEVDILVPSHNQVPVYLSSQNSFILTGNGSASAPIITAIVADLASVLDGDLNRQEAREILRATGFQSPHLPAPVLNALRAIRVGERLFAKGWAQASETQRFQLIHEVVAEGFEDEALELERKGERLPSTAKPEDRIDRLREAFYLSPTLSRALQLESSSRTHGLLDHERFYSVLARALSDKVSKP